MLHVPVHVSLKIGRFWKFCVEFKAVAVDTGKVHDPLQLHVAFIEYFS